MGAVAQAEINTEKRISEDFFNIGICDLGLKKRIGNKNWYTVIIYHGTSKAQNANSSKYLLCDRWT